MELKAPITALVFTLNEEIHLLSCLDSLQWCDDVVVVDSFSTDDTQRIALEKGARFFQNRFQGFGRQRNWAMARTSPRHPWLLMLDADEQVPSALAMEIKDIVSSPPTGVGAYRVRRRFRMWGRWLRYSSLYPTWVVRLVHREKVRYRNRGHAETEEVDGRIRALRNDLIDENVKGIDEWFERQNRYSREEADYELTLEGAGDVDAGGSSARGPLVKREALKSLSRRLPGRAHLYFFYSYILRGGFLEGSDGLCFCVMKAIYQQMVVLKKREGRMKARAAAGRGGA